MVRRQNRVYLKPKERIELQKIARSGVHAAKKIRRAKILLSLDEGQGVIRTYEDIATLCGCHRNAIRPIVRGYLKKGLKVLDRKKRKDPPIAPIVTGEIEAYIIATACSDPPAGYSRWTLTLVAQHLVEQHVIPTISFMTVQRALKKMNLNLT